jgi:putative hemolysin
VVIISNHPLGTLDGAAVFRLVSEVRPDVKVVVQAAKGLDHPESLTPLASVILPYRVNQDSASSEALPVCQEALDFLQQEGALIFFPCEDVSRMRPGGVIDTKWRSEFLITAMASRAPILPIFVDASHSALFYSISAIYKPLSSLLLVPEMHKQTGKSVSLRVGDLIAHDTFSQSRLPLKTRVKLFKKHVYKIGKGKPGIWPTQTAVAHPEPRKQLRKLIASQTRLGETQDGKQIYLYKNAGSCAVLREIGRLREVAFRAVGEGTGKRRDVDQYDALYSQLVLWDESDLEIVGAYRLADAGEIIRQHGLSGLYSSSLFDYHPAMLPILQQGAELGRSFVQPRYWGKRSLDYLWYGIGSFLRRNPHIRYLFGPVSLSNDMPKAAKDLMVYFFSLYFGQARHQAELLKGAGSKVPIPMKKLAASRQPYQLSNELVDELKSNFSGDDYKQDFKTLKHILSNMGCSVPTLFKQYSELCEPGGLVFLDFGIDSDFGDCIDGLVMVDVTRIKPKKRARYIPEIAAGQKGESFHGTDSSDDEV